MRNINDLKIGKFGTSRTDNNTGTAIILNIPDSDLEENMKSMSLRQTKKPLVCKCYKLKEHKYNGHDVYLNKEKKENDDEVIKIPDWDLEPPFDTVDRGEL